ncbi:hypothetical protein LOK49_LG03G03552 [Camellia lanceoleosa]|uniref:Uncharacterized protein n=1 Tax=Camellia lanceoleosa TaxID=1840588 RepID=A0ACC0IFE8_9ERIC|nr:hypothetical protein LOK49_LG03G03552 [Camellia lanceoleosa]
MIDFILQRRSILSPSLFPHQHPFLLSVQVFGSVNWKRR